MQSYLKPSHIEQFQTQGYCVVPMFDQKETAILRTKLDALLESFTGVPAADMTSEDLRKLPRSYTQLDLYFAPFKLEAFERAHATYAELLAATFGTQAEGFTHVQGDIEPEHSFMLCDRIGYRLPEAKQKGGGLRLHLDCNPFKNEPNMIPRERWRPIQASLALSDHNGSNDGGLGVCPGWHLKGDYWLQKGQLKDFGDKHQNFLDKKMFADVHADLVPVVHPAGSFVFWDNRLPHARLPRLTGLAPRIVLFGTFLPNTANNEAYIKQQLRAYRRNEAPPDFASKRRGPTRTVDADRRYRLSAPLQCMMGMKRWQSKKGTTKEIDTAAAITTTTTTTEEETKEEETKEAKTN